MGSVLISLIRYSKHQPKTILTHECLTTIPVSEDGYFLEVLHLLDYNH